MAYDRFWKTLDEPPDEWLDDEFPHRESIPLINRRDLLRWAGASLALAGLSGCRGLFMPQPKLVPYVDGPAADSYGQAVYFRTTATRHGYGLGLHVASREGRPIKLEGSPDHPTSRGALDSITQASLLDFYDPDRLRMVTYRGEPDTWAGAHAAIRSTLQAGRGDRVRILTETVTSPTQAALMARLSAEFPGVRWHAYEPLNRDLVYAATSAVFGRPLAPVYRFDRAQTVLAVDFDLLDAPHGSLAYARDLMDRRRDPLRTGRFSRIYSVQSTPTLTGAIADESRAMAPAEIERFLREVASVAGVPGAAAPPSDFATAVGRELSASPGACVVAVGEHQPLAIQALAHAINVRLSATVDYLLPFESTPTDQAASLRDLIRDMEAGGVDTLIVLGANPAYATPAALGFAASMARVPLKVFHGTRGSETAALCDWTLPATHFLEEWGDLRGHDGTVSLAQPLIQPLFEGRSTLDLLTAMLGRGERADALVRATWAQLASEDAWRESLRVGLVSGVSAPSPVPLTLAAGFTADSLPATPAAPFVLQLRPDPCIGDGRHANNGWLQELPKPHTGLVWDNALLLSPRTAAEVKVENGDEVRIEATGRTIDTPVWITPGHADCCGTLYLGAGRSAAGRVGNGVGIDAFPLQPEPSSFLAPASVTKTKDRRELAATQHHHRLEGRDLIHEVALGELAGYSVHQEDGPMFYDLTGENDRALPGYPQWGMVIDLNTCIGCNACVTACQAENNIPVVGKAQVAVGREMHWIRIDRYYQGSPNAPKTYFQPITCMHCETAPCEPVCPVAATVHSHEGLNQMIYNRCVGTRYCSNNCPYKVRRFNFMNWQQDQPNFQGNDAVPLLRLLNNPDVTVRSRGVMEKCTYCVQRITHARIAAEKEGRPIADGEVVTACQQACPTRTIHFGNLADPASEVSRWRRDPRNYSLLNELNTHPRTTYLARIRAEETHA